MDSFKFDNVKAEKAEATRKFNRRQTLKKLLLLFCELLMAFFSLSWLSKRIPHALEIAGDLVRGSVLVLNRPLFFFMLVNLLIVVVFVLSRRKTNSPDIYDEYAGSSRSASGNMAEEPVEETVVEKQVILADNAVLEKRAEKETATEESERAVLETVTEESERAVAETVTEESERAVSPVKQDAPKTVTGTKVTASAVTVTDTKPEADTGMEVKQSKNLLELGRSETMIHRPMVIASTESPRKSMDHMDSEEFRHTIESFIAEKKKSLILENRASLPCDSEF